ncbi:MAG: hemolysin family protein [Hymenobacteraceae bacterium]|nr:hemolysin family protein [Hymenobacteraceae bacterium]MDX5397257.1 hemolysin family protein [Hymenobacteraceae bacterium]MDX5513335.1 hemolysin family protein [Hymenobacteraceae bacterium]
MADPYIFILLTVALLFSAFFSGSEIAFITANKLQIELQEKQGSLSDKILSRFLHNPSRFVATLLIGNVLSLTLYGLLLASMLYPILQNNLPAALNHNLLIGLLQTLIAAAIALVTAEFIPRSLFAINPNAVLSALAVPLLVLYYLLWPVVYLILSITKFISLRVLKWEFSEQHPVFGTTDLNHTFQSQLYQPAADALPEVDPRIFHNAMEFGSVKVKECMVPRTEIEAVEISDGVEVLRKAFVETGHSKILVYEQTIDNIVGYCHQLEMFKKPKDIASILSSIPIVPESMLASELFVKLIGEHRSIALVVDEFGGTSGIVTIEDVVEEIFGEIHDEYDEDEWLEQEIGEGKYFFSARHEVDYLNEKYNLELPEGDYETLGGLILAVHEDFPKVGEVIQAPPYVITVISMDENRIDTVELVHNPDLELG